jgi:hypothetical protein
VIKKKRGYLRFLDSSVMLEIEKVLCWFFEVCFSVGLAY